MKKNLYVIFDCKNGSFGEIMSMENDNTAKRSFVMSLVDLPDVLVDDLALYNVGSIDSFEKMDVTPASEVMLYPSIDTEETYVGSRLVCTSREVEEDVKHYRMRNVEFSKIANSIKVDYSAKQFVENVEKLSRYFAKKDKRFNK